MFADTCHSNTPGKCILYMYMFDEWFLLFISLIDESTFFKTQITHYLYILIF